MKTRDAASAQRFRKKPVVIEALRFDGENFGDVAAFIPRESWEPVYGNTNGPLVRINTLEGAICASAGDWIIRGVQGEFYPCKPDIFEETYDPVANPDQWVSGGHEKFETPMRDAACPRGCVDIEGCCCAWNAPNERAIQHGSLGLTIPSQDAPTGKQTTDAPAASVPRSWSEEACPKCKGYDEPVCTCSPEVIARREARSAAPIHERST